MADTYKFEFTKDETLFVVACVYLASATLSRNPREALQAVGELIDIDEKIQESAALKFQSVVLPTS